MIEKYQDELINIRHATTAGRFRIGEIANRVFEDGILTANGKPFDYVAHAVGKWAGVSLATVVKYARVEKQAGHLYREGGYEALSFSQFAAAVSAGPQMLDVLNYAAEAPSVSVSALRAYAADLLRPDALGPTQPPLWPTEPIVEHKALKPYPMIDEYNKRRVVDLIWEIGDIDRKIEGILFQVGPGNSYYRKLVAARRLVASALVEISVENVPEIVNTLLID